MKKKLIALGGFMTTALLSVAAFAADEAATGGGSPKAAYAISASFAIALSSAFGALGQSRAASAALEGIGRNPGAASKVQTPMIIALALIESLVIYALVIAFLLQGYIGR